MRQMSILGCLLLALLAPAGCQRQPPSAVSEQHGRRTDAVGSGAVSTAPLTPEAATLPTPVPPDPGRLDWSPMQLDQADVEVSCNLDYREIDGVRLRDPSRQALRDALATCVENGLTRIRYRGKIDSAFASLIERLNVIADELGIYQRVLDLHSPGGKVESAIRAGDLIADSHWTIWVREGSICHSACVFILGGGDNRMIAGQVGVHRLIRMSSTANTRAELNAELRAVYAHVRDYFERNGVALAIADMMMAVPNRRIRLLSSAELQLYGLDGVNPAQDDLEHLRLVRKCGESFVNRREAFERAFERQCKTLNDEIDALNACGLELRKNFDFPDSTCPVESPFSEFDTVTLLGPSVAGLEGASSRSRPLANIATGSLSIERR